MIYQSYADKEAGRASAEPIVNVLRPHKDSLTVKLLLGWIDAYEAWLSKCIYANNQLINGATGFDRAAYEDQLDESVYGANAARAQILSVAWSQREVDRKPLIELLDGRYPPLFVQTSKEG